MPLTLLRSLSESVTVFLRCYFLVLSVTKKDIVQIDCLGQGESIDSANSVDTPSESEVREIRMTGISGADAGTSVICA